MIAIALALPLGLVAAGKPVIALSVGPFAVFAILFGVRLAACLTNVRGTDSGLTVGSPLSKHSYDWAEIDRVDVVRQRRWFSTIEEDGPSVAALFLRDGRVVKLRGLRSPWHSEPEYSLIQTLNHAVRAHKSLH
jgi:hypothetical protein